MYCLTSRRSSHHERTVYRAIQQSETHFVIKHLQMAASASVGTRPEMSDRKLDSEGAPQALRVLPPPIRTGNNDENDKEDTNQTFLLRLEKQGKTDAMNDVVSRVGSIKAQVMEWNVAEYKVKLRKGGKKTILQNVVGRAEAGFFSAILGPSGCGKTSLLDCVALRNSSFTGALRLDGQPLTSKYFLHTGYVHQKELLFSHLTVREHLTFHSVTRLSRGRTTEECLGRVEAVLQEVDMVKVGDSQIGGGELYVTKGLSGGERKRLNIATELLADPSILLLDEPTSGKKGRKKGIERKRKRECFVVIYVPDACACLYLSVVLLESIKL